MSGVNNGNNGIRRHRVRRRSFRRFRLVLLLLSLTGVILAILLYFSGILTGNGKMRLLGVIYFGVSLVLAAIREILIRIRERK